MNDEHLDDGYVYGNIHSDIAIYIGDDGETVLGLVDNRGGDTYAECTLTFEDIAQLHGALGALLVEGTR